MSTTMLNFRLSILFMVLFIKIYLQLVRLPDWVISAYLKQIPGSITFIKVGDIIEVIRNNFALRQCSS